MMSRNEIFDKIIPYISQAALRFYCMKDEREIDAEVRELASQITKVVGPQSYAESVRQQRIIP